MSLILTKIQFPYLGTSGTASGEVPFYEENGKFFLKLTGEEVTITEESEFYLDDIIRKTNEQKKG
jgi:hypothetical protein